MHVYLYKANYIKKIDKKIGFYNKLIVYKKNIMQNK